MSVKSSSSSSGPGWGCWKCSSSTSTSCTIVAAVCVGCYGWIQNTIENLMGLLAAAVAILSRWSLNGRANALQIDDSNKVSPEPASAVTSLFFSDKEPWRRLQ